MNIITKTSLSSNKYSEDIMLLDRFLDKCFARNIFLGNGEDESSRLDAYIDKLASKDIPSLRNVQKNTIKKIGSMIMGIGDDEFDRYRENHTGGESYDDVNEWRKHRFFSDFFAGDFLLVNRKILKNRYVNRVLLPETAKFMVDNIYIEDLFVVIDSDRKSIGVKTLSNYILDIFGKYGNEGLMEFYKLQSFDNHDWFHNIDTMRDNNHKNNHEYYEDFYKSANPREYKDPVTDQFEDEHKSIDGLDEVEYASLKEHQAHFTNAYRSNPDFEKYIYNTFGNLIGKLEDIASKLDNDGGYMINDKTKIDGNVFMQYMLQYILTFFGRIWNIYEDKYIVGLMSGYDVKLLPLHEKIIKGIWSNDHHFKLANGKKIDHQESYKIATYNN